MALGSIPDCAAVGRGSGESCVASVCATLMAVDSRLGRADHHGAAPGHSVFGLGAVPANDRLRIRP